MPRNSILCLAISVLMMPSAFGQLGFTNATTSMSNTTHSGGCMGVVDMNGDGLDDLAKLHLSTNFHIDYQNADGTFTLVDHGPVSDEEQWGMTIGDIRNTGHKDMISGGSYDGVHYLDITGVGAATLLSLNNGSIFMQGNNVADIDADGHNDFFGCHDHAEPKIWMNDGTGELIFDATVIDFTTDPPSDMSGNYGSVWTDFDNDGDLDLYIAKCKQGVTDQNNPLRWNQLFVNDGNGNFSELAEEHGVQVRYQSWTADFGDIDNDGDFDMVVTNHDHTIQLFLNDGTGNFTEITAGSGLEITGFFLQSKFVDFDNDGFIDLLVAGGIERLFKNNGNNTFTLVSGMFPAGKAMHSFATGDLNNDGFQDVFASYGSGYVEPDMSHADRLWINNGNDNHWLTVRLQGTISNRDAIGARVTITGPWGTQIREVRAGESYGIVTTFACSFGLGQATTIPTMTIDWPNGLQEVFTNIDVDQTITVIEGTCISPAAQITFPGASVLCSGAGPLTLEAPAGFNYNWSSGATTQQLVITEPGIYSVIIDDGSACTGVASVSVPLDPDQTPVVTGESELQLCQGTSVQLVASSEFPMTWSTGETGDSIEVSEAGEYSVTINGSCASFTSDPIVVTTLAAPTAPITSDASINIGEQTTLTAIGEGIVWFDQADATIPIGTGPDLQTPLLFETTSYWAASTIEHEGEISYGGKTDSSGIGAYHTNATYFLLFDAYEPFTIISVKVYANGAANRTIALVDQANGGTVISEVFNIPGGESRVQLDFEVPASGSYGLRVVGGNPQLWRDPIGSGVSYPYALGDVGAITSSTAGSQLYYFFYDWEVAPRSIICESPRVEAVVNVGGTGISDQENGAQMNIWPNPADKILTITHEGVGSDVTIEMLDMLGRTVLIEHFNGSAANGPIQLDISSIAPGDHIVRSISAERTFVQHVIIH